MPQLCEQPALPDAGRTLDKGKPAAAAHGVSEHRTKRLDLAVTLEKQFG